MDFSNEQRLELWHHLIDQIERWNQQVSLNPVTPPLDVHLIRQFVEKGKAHQGQPKAVLDHVVEGLSTLIVQTGHPAYFGLFNPKGSFAGILADALLAAFNPQLAAWSHAPWANEIERDVIQRLGERFGFDPIDGTVASGGQEANLTAVLCALHAKFPSFGQDGVQGQPVLYTSAESHHSVLKSAACTGLGRSSVRNVPTIDLKMDVDVLDRMLQEDVAAGRTPFLVVATMGTTGTGVIDPIEKIHTLTQKYGCWLHADAAWGGGLVIHPQYKEWLQGIERADSITFDAHKWWSVPMGTSVWITRHPEILGKTFRISAEYMPKEGAGQPDPFAHSLPWSRRFLGLRIYLAWQIYGDDGLAEIIEHQIELGHYLRERLIATGWEITNPTNLPVVCFKRPHWTPNRGIQAAQEAISSGKVWISAYPIEGTYSLRACMTNFNTQKDHIDELIQLLEAVD